MLLEVRALKKRFAGVRALDGVDLDVAAGSVHGLLGANGAGKSTLIQTLSGLLVPDSGSMALDGVVRSLTSVRAAEALGLRFIHQELHLVPHFTAIENGFVGRPHPRRGPFIDRAAMRHQVAVAASQMAPGLPLDVPASRLGTGQRQLIAIVRALVNPGARLVVMDEPTAALSSGEAARLHHAVRALAGQGVAVLFISHRLDEVQDLCDRYTVLRNGKTAGSGAMAGTSRAQLVRLMGGHDAPPPPSPARAAPRPSAAAPCGQPVLDVAALPFGPAGSTLSLHVHAGEIVGLYGLVGAGRSALLEQIWGARRHAGGRIVLDGAAMRPQDIGQRMARGGAWVPEDRRGAGLIAPRSIAENLALPDLAAVRARSALPLVSRRRLLERTETIRQQLAIKMDSPHARPLTLSGGNQQKLLFGRWCGRRPVRLLLLDEPTRGVDIGAKAEIHAIIRQMATQGAAVLMATSDMDELLRLAQRVLVMAGGRITAGLTGAEITPDAVLTSAFAHTGAGR